LLFELFYYGPLQDRPTLTIGHHLLEGKVATLPKPLAVLQRSGSSQSKQGVRNHDLNIEDDRDAMEDHSSDSTVEQATPSWDVVAVVKRKIIFSKRPMPIVGSSTDVTKKH